jgi:hypothetical protein
VQARTAVSTGARDENNYPTSLTEEDIFEVLSNQRRRYVLHYLEHRESDVATLGDLAEQVAAWEYDKPVAGLTSAERKRVKNALHQFHLPKMDDCGFLEYDRSRGIVALTDAAADLEVYVEVVPTKDIPWGPYYVALTALHVPVVLGHWFAVPPVASVPLPAILLVLLVSVSVSALVHTYLSYSRMRLGAGVPRPEVDD